MIEEYDVPAALRQNSFQQQLVLDMLQHLRPDLPLSSRYQESYK